MLLWGAAWGAILGLFGSWGSPDLRVIAGAALGWAAAWTLRAALRKEFATRATPSTSVLRAPAQEPVPQVPPQLEPQPQAQRSAPEPVEAMPRAVAIPQEDDVAPSFDPVQPRSPSALETLFARARDWLLGGNTVVRVGLLVLFIGLAFLARYAVENALLPPEARLAAIAAAGIALFVLGVRLRSRAPDRRGYAITLQGGGVAVLYLPFFAAFRLYQFLPAGPAFVALALVCAFSTAIALAQDAQALAFIGFAGGFAAPVLVSTGDGSHVALFGYYLLLGVGIAAIAWLRAWRALNVLGFVATFAVAAAWGVLKYRPEQFASTEPFLVAFFLLYLLASLFYALRHGHGAKRAVDATLVFGTPLVAFGLQAGLVRDVPHGLAFSALALAALYVALGAWLLRRRAGDKQVHRWLAQCFLALALGFVTLAVPLALEGRWTPAVWAVEGTAVYWMGRRQQRWLARAFGLALQVFAALLFFGSGGPLQQGAWPVANAAFLGAAMLAGAALTIGWWARAPLADADASPAARAFAGIERNLAPVLLWAGFLWVQAAFAVEIGRSVADSTGLPLPLLPEAQRHLLRVAAWVLSAAALQRLARGPRGWDDAAMPAWFDLPLMLAVALSGLASQQHVFAGVGWIAWPAMLLAHFYTLHALDAGAPRRWWPWVHAGGVWLLVLLAANLLLSAIDRAQLWHTAWATVILLAAGSAVLLALVFACTPALGASGRRWPLDRFAPDYAWRAAAPIALALAVGALLVAVSSSGQTRPLPYVPLLNPTDLAVALAVATCWLWLARMRRAPLALPRVLHAPAPVAVLVAIAFVAINTVWLRVAHHYADVPWDAHSLFASFLVQAGYSILWTLIAVVLMVAAHRGRHRTTWMLGAGLLALTVLKLFLVDLSNRGGAERIVVFIAVGVLMLLVGWFAPLPPAQERDAGLRSAA